MKVRRVSELFESSMFNVKESFVVLFCLFVCLFCFNEFLGEMLMLLKRGQKHIIIKLLSCVFSDLKRIIADITGPCYSVLNQQASPEDRVWFYAKATWQNYTETISLLLGNALGKWVRAPKGRATETRKFVRREDWYLVHQNLLANRFGTMFDVCRRLVPVLCRCLS